MITRIVLVLVGFALTLSSEAQNWKQQYDELIAARKYASAYNFLNRIDPSGQEPAIAIAKMHTTTAYFIKSVSHTQFAMKDLAAGETLDALRSKGEQTNTIVIFDAAEVLTALAAKHPTNYQIHQALGEYYFEVHKRFPNNWKLSKQEVLDRMKQHFKTADTHGAGNYLTTYCQGYYASLGEKYEEAVGYYLRSLEANEAYPFTSMNLAVSYFYLEQPQKGIEHGKRALQHYKKPIDKGEAARVVGMLYQAQENYPEAIRWYEKSEQLYPGAYYTHKNRLEAALKGQMENKFPAYAQSFLDLNPRDTRIYAEIIQLYTNNGYKSRLEGFLTAQLPRWQSDAEVSGFIHFFLASFFLDNNNKPRAEKEFALAKSQFKQVYPENHKVFQIIDGAMGLKQ